MSEIRNRRDGASGAPLLSVIMPVYNEVGTVDEAIRRVLAAPFEKQFVVIDDGSTDGTSGVLERWAARGDILLVRHERNQGKGTAVRTGLAHARGRFTVIQDADLECDPQDYGVLMEPLLREEADVVFGSRFLFRQGVGNPWRMARVGVAVLNAFVRLLYGVRLTDEATCFKVLSTKVLQGMELECQRFEFCPEVTAKACRMGLSIVEVPVHYKPRTYSQGKKIRWKDGWTALLTLWRFRRWKPASPKNGVEG